MYRIKDWDTVYENKESRKVKHARYVCVPNKQDGKGFRRLEQHPRKVELFCAWNLILQVASKCPTRGVLVDSDGPMTPADLALKTTYPEAIFSLAFEFFSSGGKLAWLEPIGGSSGWTPEVPPADPEMPGDAGKPREIFPDAESASNGHAPGDFPGGSRHFPIEGNGREGKGTYTGAEKNPNGLSPKAEYWDALLEIFDLHPTSHRDELKLYGQCAEFRQKGATVQDIRDRAALYREKWSDLPCTVNAVLNNWDVLIPKRAAPASRLGNALSDRMLA